MDERFALTPPVMARSLPIIKRIDKFHLAIILCKFAPVPCTRFRPRLYFSHLMASRRIKLAIYLHAQNNGRCASHAGYCNWAPCFYISPLAYLIIASSQQTDLRRCIFAYLSFSLIESSSFRARFMLVYALIY